MFIKWYVLELKVSVPYLPRSIWHSQRWETETEAGREAGRQGGRQGDGV
jgi:hypothetical protein